MANEQQLAILKQGVDVWNQWREDNRDSKIDLDLANLRELNLRQVDFWKARLVGADLSGADLWNANFRTADLYYVDFREADLRSTDLRGADLRNADLSGADLRSADLSGARLTNAIFSKTIFGYTSLGGIDLRAVTSVAKARHYGPSYLDTKTLQVSQGKISEEFLRGCGLSDIDIEYAKLANLELTAQKISDITHSIFELKDTRPIQISHLFISYSHADSVFVNRIEPKLKDKNIRFWRDIHDATAGRLEKQIDRAIRYNPTVLLILSEHSTSSDWVEHEARLARKLEKELGRDVLCPIALDDSWKTCNWPERIKEQIMEYNILDFSNWEDDDELDAMFKKSSSNGFCGFS